MEVRGQFHILVALPAEVNLSVRIELAWAPEPLWTNCGRYKLLTSTGKRITAPRFFIPQPSYNTD